MDLLSISLSRHSLKPNFDRVRYPFRFLLKLKDTASRGFTVLSINSETVSIHLSPTKHNAAQQLLPNMMYFLAFMLFVATLTPSYAQMSCSCTCCVGINCSPSNVGSASASDCNSCDAACSSAYSSCPSSGQSGTVSTSCSSGGGSPPPSTSGTIPLI